jgi:ABC-type uncharacterized transport system involved in gliding motility auxiliary subunit
MKPFDLLTPVAIVYMAGAYVALMQNKLPGDIYHHLIIATALIVTHVVLRRRELGRVVGKRQLMYGGNAFIFSIAVGAILVGLNYLAFRHGKRWDLTKSQRFSLSEQTRKVLTGLKEDIKLTYFQRREQMAYGRDRLKTYEALSKHLKVDYVDPMVDPIKAQSMDVRGPWPMLVFERAGRRERTGADSEQDITNAIIKVTRDKKKTVCFGEGEGERDSDNMEELGIGRLKAALQKESYETQKATLMREGSVPAACDVFVVAGPTKDLLPAAIDALRNYLKAGGKLLVMVEPEKDAPYPNLAGLLKEFNIEAGNNVVLDRSPRGQALQMGPLTPVVERYPHHDITKDFKVVSVFHTARTMTAVSAAPEGITVQNLAETSEQSWGETDLSFKNPRPDPQDPVGPLAIAALATVKTGATAGPDGADAPEGRLVAFGDVDFATNQLIGMMGNQDLVLNSVAWLSQDANLISVRPGDIESNRLFLTQGQRKLFFAFSCVLVPSLFIVGGIVSWWRRRG